MELIKKYAKYTRKNAKMSLEPSETIVLKVQGEHRVFP